LTRIILARHGHVEGIDPPRFRGWEDLPLTGRGKAEALAAARRISQTWRPACVYTSPLSRCVQTGAAIAGACKIQSQIIRELNDLDYGDWQSKRCEEMAASEPALYALWSSGPQLVRFPGGESLQDLVLRSADAMRLVLERHPDETVVMVAHDSINRALLVQLADFPLSSYWILGQDPCCINEIDVVGPRVQIRAINDTAHLNQLVDDAGPPTVP
jgi:probable phosphoglycerate mutase